MPRTTILTDVDGVVLDWEEGFSVWMEHHGHQLVDGYQFIYSIGDRYGMSRNAGHKLVKQFFCSCRVYSVNISPAKKKLFSF